MSHSTTPMGFINGYSTYGQEQQGICPLRNAMLL